MSRSDYADYTDAEIRGFSRLMSSTIVKQQESVDSLHERNRRLRDACRSTNRGITRLSKRCQSQAKKIAELKALLLDAGRFLNACNAAHVLQAEIDIALHGRRPAEKAT